MTLQVDASEVRQLAVDLGKAGATIGKDVHDVVSKGALNLKNDYNQQIAGSSHFSRWMAGCVTYDMSGSATSVEAEVGPDKSRRGGPLGNIFFFGTSRGGGTGDLDGPLREEEPRFVKALTDLATEDML